MQRVNPATRSLFKRGDCVERDGKRFYFHAYNRKRVKLDGFQSEVWCTEEKWRTYHGSERGLETVVLNLFHQARARAVKYNGQFALTKDWIRERVIRGCAVTGLQFDLAGNGKGHGNSRSPSLDRIDNDNRNYTPENTRVVCYQVNLAKGWWSDRETLFVLRKFVRHLEDELEDVEMVEHTEWHDMEDAIEH